MKPTFETRPATEADYEFLYELRCQTLKEYVDATWGWDEEWQVAHFRERFHPGNTRIIRVGGADVGCVVLEDHGGHVFLANVALLPAFQGQGVGTAIVREIVERAERRGVPVRLTVLTVNPAQRLYSRLGFRVTHTADFRVFMEWRPGNTDRGSP